MMGGALGDTFDYKGEFEKRLQKILRRGTKIIVIQSPDDTLPLGDESLIAAGFQYRFLENDPNTPSWLNEIEVHTVKLDKEWYETGHNYFFDTYAVENIKNGVYVDPQGTSTSLEANFDSGKDSDSPIVQAFQVTPLSLTTGESFTIDYTVSDIDGSGLKQVELWRKDEQSDWREIKRNELSGNNGPVSGSFTDSPSAPGKYWYGVHVVDNAGNWNDETNSNTNNPSVSFGPIEVEIKKAQGSGSSVVGKWACQSSDECVTNYDWSTSETDTAVSNIGNFYIDFYNDGTFIISNEENTETTIGEWTQYGNTIRFQCKPFEEEIHDENAYGYQTIVWQSKGDTYEGTIDGDTISGTISSSFYIGGRYRNEPDSRPSHDIGEVSCPGRWSASRI